MINSKVENKYNLSVKDIRKAVVLNRERLKEKPFWRNNVIDAWCLSGNTAKTLEDEEFGTYNSYWIGFYDEDAKAYAGKIRVECSSYGGMCKYVFDKFYREKDIRRAIDLEIQEKLLKMVNWLIDEKIIYIPGKDGDMQ